MSKKLLFLISFVLLLALVGNTRAAVMTWDNNGGTGDRLWDTPLNWDADIVPGASDDVVIDDLYTDATNGPEIFAGISAVCNSLSMGESASPSVEAVLGMTGGTLDVDGIIHIGDDTAGDYRFDLSNGTVTTGGHIYIGNLTGTNGTLNLSGGDIVGGGNFYVGYDNNSVGTVNMTSGSISVAGLFYMPQRGTAQATFNMDGGNITTGADLNVAFEGDANCTVTITDGNIFIGEDLELAQYDNTSGTINISGGTIEIVDDIYLGWMTTGTGTALINMTGGTVTLNVGYPKDNGWLTINERHGTGGGHLNMGGGTLSAYNISMGINGSMSISYGTLIFEQDVTGTNDWLWDPDAANWDGTLLGLANQGVITVFGSNHGDIIADANFLAEVGKRAVLVVDYDSRIPGKTTVTADTIDPDFAWNPSPVPGSVGPPPEMLSWEAGATATAHQIYLGTSFNDVNDANTLSDEYMTEQVLADVNYEPSGLWWGTDYFWRIDEVTGGSPLKGLVWSFTTMPAKATEPDPYDGQTDVSPYTSLSWIEGPQADTHELYLSSNFNEVNDRSIPPAYPGTNSYDPGALELNTTYYWAVDEVNLAADVTTWYGDVWSFTTDDHLIVDDFDSYANNDDLWTVWDDYWTNDTGAEIFMETDLAYDGNSIKFNYDNTYRIPGNVYGSWADADTVDLPVGSDWTLGGAKALWLVFYGDPANSTTVNDKMYVALDDGDTVESSYYPDVNDINEESWHEWHIDLEEEFSTVNLANVSRISIGFGAYGGTASAGGTGAVYFDRIEVRPPYCRSEFFLADIDNDCTADLADLQIMSTDWLIQDYNFIANNPSEANLIGWWKFDEGTGTIAADSSVYSNDGNIVDAIWTTGYPNDPCDSGLDFDGDGFLRFDQVIVAEREGNTPGTYPAELMPSDAFTIACWTRLRNFGWFDAFVSFTEDTYADECGFALYNGGWEGTAGNDFCFQLRTMTGGMSYLESENFGEINTWYHVAGTYDGSEARLYVDAQLARTPLDVGGPMRWESFELGDYPSAFVIGAYVDRNEYHSVRGIIDDVRYYDYALSQGELSVLAELVVPGADVYQSVPSLANIADPEPELSRKVNFVDYAVMADSWLIEQLWP